MSKYISTLDELTSNFTSRVGYGLTGSSFIDKFGHNAAVAATYETVWEGSAVYTYMDPGEQLKISSDSANDDPDGGTTVGAHTIELQGHDNNHDIITETITLNGLGVVTTTKSFHRIFRALVKSAGTDNTNVGTISIKNNAADTTQALISPGLGQTLMALWTVPRNQRFYLTHWWAGESGNKSSTIALMVREGVTHSVWNNKQTQIINNNEFNHPFPYPLGLDGPCDIEVRAKSVGGGGLVSAGFAGFWGPK